MGAVIFVNVWRGTPFFAISLLAGLQTIPQDLYEAAAIDGATAPNRFRHVTIPLLMPVLTIVMLFSIIQTFADFQIVQVLTRGGPADSTHLFATLAFQVGMQGGRLGQGAAVSLYMLPFLGLLVVAQLWYTRRNSRN
jgi:multiple sugar transport system permease protein